MKSLVKRKVESPVRSDSALCEQDPWDNLVSSLKKMK